MDKITKDIHCKFFAICCVKACKLYLIQVEVTGVREEVADMKHVWVSHMETSLNPRTGVVMGVLVVMETKAKEVELSNFMSMKLYGYACNYVKNTTKLFSVEFYGKEILFQLKSRSGPESLFAVKFNLFSEIPGQAQILFRASYLHRLRSDQNQSHILIDHCIVEKVT